MKDRIRSCLNKLSLKRYLGCRNKCPYCGRTGDFGSIVRFIDGDKVYMVCGWCKNFKEVGKTDEKIK